MKMQTTMTLSDFNKPVDIQAPDVKAVESAPDGQTAVTTEALETGWTRVDIPEKGFAISSPPSWKLDTTKISVNLRSDIWLVSRESRATAGQEVRSQLLVQLDEFFHIYDSLDEYLDYFKGNVTFISGITSEDLEVQKVQLPAGEAAALSFSNISSTLGVELSHLMYILPWKETTFIVTFTVTADRMEEMTPLFKEIAESVETYDPID